MYRTSPGHAAVLEASQDPRSREELQKAAGIRHRQHFLLEHLRPLLDAGLIELTIPDKPLSSKQRYRLTVAGIAYLSGSETKKPTQKGRGKKSGSKDHTTTEATLLLTNVSKPDILLDRVARYVIARK
jgi:ATP-dependent DNA helicase RecG